MRVNELRFAHIYIYMDNNATDPLLFAMQPYESADILELCRIFILDVYLKHYGKSKAFVLLQHEYEFKNLSLKLPVQLLLILFTLTWFLNSSLYRLLAHFCQSIARSSMFLMQRINNSNLTITQPPDDNRQQRHHL